MLPPGPGVVGFSGGPDSTFLVLALRDMGREVHLAHLDHALRSDHLDEVAWVGDFAERLALGLTQETLSELPGGSVEAAARSARYRFLERVARRVGASWVATGHTLDDQAETLLMRLERGTGLRGMTGIRRCRPIDWGSEIQLFRPLLELERDEIRASLTVPAYEDPSNVDPVYRRNRLRAELMPRLAALKGRIARLAGGSLQLVCASRGQAEQELERLLLDPAQDPLLLLGRTDLLGKRACLLDRGRLAELPLERLPWVLEAGLGAGLPVLERDHIEACRMLLDRGAGKRLDLPGGWHVLFESGWIGLSRQVPEPLPGLQPRPFEPGAALDPLPLAIDATGLPAGQWVVRGRHTGDRLRRTGGSREIRRLQNDLGVPSFLRNAWPLLVNGDEVIWMPGVKSPEGLVLSLRAVRG